METASWSPRRLNRPRLVLAMLLAALISALSLLLAPAVWGQTEDLNEQSGPGAPGQDGADSVGGGSGQSGRNSKGSDGTSSKGASARSPDVEEIVVVEEVETPSATRRSTSPSKKAAPTSLPPQPTADLLPGQQPAPISSGPAETLVANQPPLRAESTADRNDTLAWLLTLAGSLLALVLLVGKVRGVGGSGRRSLRDATA